MITTSKPKKELQEVVRAFHRGGGKGKPMYLKMKISYIVRREGIKRAGSNGKPTLLKTLYKQILDPLNNLMMHLNLLQDILKKVCVLRIPNIIKWI